MSREGPREAPVPPVSEAMAAVLRAERDGFNHRFAEARHRLPGLDGEGFTDFLRRRVDPMALAMASHRPERVPEVVHAGYDLGLELVGRRLVRPGSAIADGWRLLPLASLDLLAEAPRRLLVAISNALHQLATHSEADPEGWILRLAELAPHCSDLDTLLRVGQVAAWRHGLAHYRQSALDVAVGLEAPLALAAVGALAPSTLPTRTDATELAFRWGEIHRQLLDDPWLDPGLESREVPVDAEGPRIARWAGAFSGFGGDFPEPPRVWASDGVLRVASDGSAWRLEADRFGATFHRDGVKPPPRRRAKPRVPAALEGTALGPPTSSARIPEDVPHTLAVTFLHTHRVALVPLRGPQPNGEDRR